MSEGTMAVVKPEMKSYIWVQTADGSIQQVEEEVAMFCPMICREVLQTAMGSSKNYAISLPQRVNPATLGLILDYCRFHQLQGRSNKERKIFDEKFVRLDTEKLCRDEFQAVSNSKVRRDSVKPLDLASSKGQKYIWYATSGYGVGLVTALAAGILTRSPQPALLYLVPSTLGPIVVVSWMRKELLELWEGQTPDMNDKAHLTEV